MGALRTAFRKLIGRDEQPRGGMALAAAYYQQATRSAQRAGCEAGGSAAAEAARPEPRKPDSAPPPQRRPSTPFRFDGTAPKRPMSDEEMRQLLDKLSD